MSNAFILPGLSGSVSPAAHSWTFHPVAREQAMEAALQWVSDCAEPSAITRFELREDGNWFFEYQSIFQSDPAPNLERDGWGVALVNQEGFVEPQVGRLSFHRRIRAYESKNPDAIQEPSGSVKIPTVDEAQTIAQDFIARTCFFEPAQILPERTISKPYGWIFYYQSKRFLTWGNHNFKLRKSSPLLIRKDSGKVVIFGSLGYKEFEIPITREMRKSMTDLTSLAVAAPFPHQPPLSEEQARYIAQSYLDARFIAYDGRHQSFGCKMRLIPHQTTEKPTGWVYHYAPQEHVHTDQSEAPTPHKLPAGSHSIFVLKDDGAIFDYAYHTQSKTDGTGI